MFILVPGLALFMGTETIHSNTAYAQMPSPYGMQKGVDSSLVETINRHINRTAAFLREANVPAKNELPPPGQNLAWDVEKLREAYGSAFRAFTDASNPLRTYFSSHPLTPELAMQVDRLSGVASYLDEIYWLLQANDSMGLQKGTLNGSAKYADWAVKSIERIAGGEKFAEIEANRPQHLANRLREIVESSSIPLER